MRVLVELGDASIKICNVVRTWLGKGRYTREREASRCVQMALSGVYTFVSKDGTFLGVGWFGEKIAVRLKHGNLSL